MEAGEGQEGEGKSYRTKCLTCGIRYYLWVDSVKIHLNSQTLLLSRNCLLVWGTQHTLKSGPRTQFITITQRQQNCTKNPVDLDFNPNSATMRIRVAMSKSLKCLPSGSASVCQRIEVPSHFCPQPLKPYS